MVSRLCPPMAVMTSPSLSPQSFAGLSPSEKADDEHAVGKELDADGLSDGDQLADRPVRRLCRRHCDRGGGKKSQQDRRRSLFCAVRSIHSHHPFKKYGGRRAPVRAARSRPPNAGNFFFLISFFSVRAHLLSALRAKLKGGKILMRWHRFLKWRCKCGQRNSRQTKVCGILGIVSI